MMADEAPRGLAAERYAVHMLEARGYRVLATNYRARAGEIDVVATVDELLIFVEVKERTGDRFGSAEEAVDKRKLNRILSAADVFVAEHPEFAYHIWRLDLIAITLNRDGTIRRRRHIENLVVD